MTSLRSTLARVGRTIPFRLREGPTSLRALMDQLQRPRPAASDLVSGSPSYTFSVNNAQGLCYAGGKRWILVSSQVVFAFEVDDPAGEPRFRRIGHRDKGALIRECGLNPEQFFDEIPGNPLFRKGMWGDMEAPAYGHGLIWVPIECRKQQSDGVLLLALNEDLKVVAFARPEPTIGSQLCAIHPWTGYLYMTDESLAREGLGLSRFASIDPAPFVQALKDRGPWGRRVACNLGPHAIQLYEEGGHNRVNVPGDWLQGMCISNHGVVYVSSCTELTAGGASNSLSTYEALSGRRIGVQRDDMDFDGVWDEIEGIALHPSGVLYVAATDNDDENVGTDEFNIYVFRHRAGHSLD